MLENKKLEYIEELKQRVKDKIMNEANANFLAKLIMKADSLEEVQAIMAMGTTYKRTGFHFDFRKEPACSNIKYLKKNEKLSFVTDKNALTHKLIIGDNYDALRQLLITHRGKIDVIYIDPPYGKDNMGNFAETNYTNAITRDNLLSMLYVRLQLARDLLSENGVIFCSIDDRNWAYLKCLMDEIFGESNYIGSPIRQKNKLVMKGDKTFKNILEPLLVYAKNKKNVEFSYTKKEEVDSDFSMIASSYEEKTIIFEPGKLNFRVKMGFVPKGQYNNQVINNDIIIEDNKNVNSVSITGCFKWSQAKIDEKLNSNAYVLIKRLDTMALRIHFVGNTAKPLDFVDSKYGSVTNEDGIKMLKDIFSDDVFDYPKPVDFIKFLLNIYNNTNAIVLDFFAGSGTTGQAVLEQNKEDDGSRKFILCTNNEKEDGYIAENVTSKRLKRVMTGSCYDGTTDFKWNNNNSPLGDNLEVTEIAEISSTIADKDNTPFDVIDESLYDILPFDEKEDKINWICTYFKNTMKGIESDKKYIERWGE